MKKTLFTTLLSILLYSNIFCQGANPVLVDSLKKRLPSLKDSARVDILNELSMAFITTGPHFAPDSVNKYALEANREAVKIGYKKGEAFSLVNLIGNDPGSNLTRAISIGEIIKDSKLLGMCYLDSTYNRLKENIRIEILKKALTYFEQANYLDGKFEANMRLADVYTSNGKYEEGFKYLDQCTRLLKQGPFTPWGQEMVLWYFIDIASLYERAGDYETSLQQLRQGNQYARKYQVSWNLESNMLEAFTKSGQYDSAFYYWKKLDSTRTPYQLTIKQYWIGGLGEIYLKTKQYDKALKIAEEGIAYFKERKNTGFALMGHLLSAAKVYTELKNYKPALPYAKEGVILAKKNAMLSSEMEGCQLLADIYHHLGDNANAYNYILQYHSIKDSLQSQQFLLKMAYLKWQAGEERKESQINFLNKENQLKKTELKQQALIKNSFIAGLILVMLLGIFIFRNQSLKRKNEKLRSQQLEKELRVQQLQSEQKQSELQRQAIELEMQALRAQMNPHFIFNCLSSINRFILKNEVEAASDYLTRFSRLIRMVLINSQQSLISLEDELEMLRLYLDMERLRFKNAFDCNITFTNRVDAGSVFIPPLLLQPFCENAIWHGLMHKDGHGELSVSLSMEEGSLKCLISDNGIGRKKAAELKSKSAEKEKSLGLQITKDRLTLINDGINGNAFFNIDDLVDENGNASGTRTCIKIKVKDDVAVETFKNGL